MKCLRIKRTAVSLLEKLEVWDKVNRGMSTAAVRHHYSVNELISCLIKKHAEKTRGSVTVNGPPSAAILT